MALPFFTPIMNLLPDGGVYDVETGAPIQQMSTPLATKVAADTADIDAEIAAARAERDRIRTAANKPGLGPKAAAARQSNLTAATNTLKSLQEQKKNLVAADTTPSPEPIFEPAPTDEDDTGDEPTIYTAPDGQTFTDQQAYVNYLSLLDRQRREVAGAASTAALDAASTARTNRNAKEFLLGTLKQYFSNAEDTGFLSQLEGIIDDYVKQDYDVDTISVLLPQSAPYKERFKGNVARTSSGLSPLSPAEYLQAETQYNEILKRFNLGDLARRDTFATLIGGQVSAAELTDRVVNVYDRIRNADPALRAELNRVEGLGGNITDADFAKALLTGAEGANELKRKISTAEISAEARSRGLGVTSAEQLQQRGITREQASAGFEQIRLTQPTMEKLSDIYRRDLTPTTPEGNIARTQEFQTELEREQFGGLASERRRRLAEQEQTAFMGQSGTAAGVSLGRRRRGQF